MKKALFVALAVMMLLVNGPAKAQGVTVDRTLDCGMWIKARNEKLSGSFELYLIGLINGLTLGHMWEFWKKGSSTSLNRESVYIWMDSYCRDNPLKDVESGVVELYKDGGVDIVETVVAGHLDSECQ